MNIFQPTNFETANLRQAIVTFVTCIFILGMTCVLPVRGLHASDDEDTVNDPQQATDATHQPKTKSGRALLAKWQANARSNGMIPGGTLQALVDATQNFVRLNSTDKRVPRLNDLLKRMDVSHDWTTTAAIRLLDDVVDVFDLADWALDHDRFETSSSIRTGTALPANLKDAPWGNPKPNGLRIAWLLNPNKKEHRLNTPLKSRVLIHNAGNQGVGIGVPRTIVFKIQTWFQSSGHTAKHKNKTPIKLNSTFWTGIPQIAVCRLAPGEYIELSGAGIGVGKNVDIEDWRNTRVGTWIHAQAGDEVTFAPAAVGLNGRGNVDSEWWRKFIAKRLKREMPFPTAPAERTRSLDRALRDLFGMPATPQQAAEFVADTSPQVLDNLVARLVARPGVESFTGELQSGETTFQVLPVDPHAAKKPRLAVGRGRYQLNKTTRLVIVARSIDGQRIHEAHLEFSELDSSDVAKLNVKLPDDGAFAIAWERVTADFIWVATKGILHYYEFSDPSSVIQKRIKAADTIYLPPAFRMPLKSVLMGPESTPPSPEN